MKKIFFTLILTAFLSSCSVDPEVDFKGKIDEDFLLSISRGEVSMTLSPNDKKSHIFTRPCEDGKPSEKWKVDDAWGESAVHIFSGSKWVYYGKLPSDREDYLCEGAVETAWGQYKLQIKDTNSKIQMRKCSFEYDPQTKKVLFDDKWWNVESASKGKIVISYSFECNKDNHPQPVNIAKHVYTFNVKSLYYDPDNVDTYESAIDAMLSHIRILRNYKGDIWTFYNGESKLNLAKLEEALLAGKIKYEDLDEGEYEAITMCEK
ncbi:MAG: membrane lipoprotein lipid attachment site-containing protein [Muribaculaceae bacterium]|nr:membrane lipoprotein lipid attachment site-containing protein [Muribaculaceae bacterium]